MPNVTVNLPKPAPPAPESVTLDLSYDEALELAGILGRGKGLVGGLYNALSNALEDSVGAHLSYKTGHPAYRKGYTAAQKF